MKAKHVYWRSKPGAGLGCYGLKGGVYRVVIEDGFARLYGARGRYVWQCNVEFLKWNFERVRP